MLFPISDDNRGITTTAYVTYFFLAINVLVFLYQMQNPDFTYGWSMVPKEITTGQDIVTPTSIETSGGEAAEIPHAPGPPIIWLTLLTSMFMHGGIGHIAGNMLYLWIFGNNVEHRFGHVLFLVFYLLSGLVGSLAQIVVDPDGVIPNLGASGAIAGVMGAYLILYPPKQSQRGLLYYHHFNSCISGAGHVGHHAIHERARFHYRRSRRVGRCCLHGSRRGLRRWVNNRVGGAQQVSRRTDSVLRRQYASDPAAKRIW